MARSNRGRPRAPLGSCRGGREAAVLAATLISITIALSGPRVALADAYCGAGKHVGAENDGAGLSWICVPDRNRPISIPSIGGGSGAGAGLAGAAAGLEGLAALLAIVNELGGRIDMTDTPSAVSIDPDGWGVRSRDANRRAIDAMQNGRFDQAAVLFNEAEADALKAYNVKDAKANARNARLADAENWLKQGYLQESRGDLAAASNYYLRGKQAAEAAGSNDLAGKLAAYNDRLVARAGSNSGVNPTQDNCARVNDQFLCR